MYVRPVFTCFLLLLGLLSLCGCRQQAESDARVLLRVDGRSVSLARFDAEFERRLPAGAQFAPEEWRKLRRAYLAEVLERELALAEADRLQVTVAPEELATALEEAASGYTDEEFDALLKEQGLNGEEWRRQLAEGLRIEKVVELAAYSGVRITDSQVEAYYREHRDEFSRPRQVRARQLVVADRETGEKVLGLLRQGEDFADLARRFSLSPDAEQGGDLGWFAAGQMPPEFDAVVFKLVPGQTSDLVKSPYGYHLFRVEKRRRAKKLRLAEAAPEIRARLRREAEREAYRAWMKNLRERARVEIDTALLEETAGDG